MLCYIILNYNDFITTYEYVNSIINYSVIDKIVIVDNCSTDNSYKKLRQLNDKKVDVIKTQNNGGYGSGNNFGVTYAQNKYSPEYIVISNPDISISEETIRRCLSFMQEKNDATLVVPLMLNRQGEIVYNCVWKIPTYYQYLLFSLYLLGKLIRSNNYSPDEFYRPFSCGCVAGSWLMLRTEDFIESGMYDENIFLYCEETVLGIKLRRKNKKSYILPDITFTHEHSVSISKSIKSEYKQQKLMWKSRVYVLDHYFEENHKVLSRIISRIGLLEWRVIHAIKRTNTRHN